MWRYWIVVCCCLPSWAVAEVFFGHVTQVSDGDTLWVKPEGNHAPRKLRLQGLDAPEICQPGGVEARAALQQLLVNQRLRVTVKYQDTYGRGLARVRAGEQDVGASMVQAGQAWSSRWHRSLGPYATQESQARAERRGLFADPAAELPRDFRKRTGSCYSAKR